MSGCKELAAALAITAWAIASCTAPPAALPPAPPGSVGGIVFHDRDRDGRRGAGEPGIPGVAVSNGREVVRSGRGGLYQLPIREDAIYFIVQPRSYRVPVDANGVPRFYYVHKPAGSPRYLRYPGVPPTGPLPARIDFALRHSSVGDRFSALLLGDTQTRDVTDVEHLARDVVAPLIGTRAAFGIALGDLAYDDLSVYAPLMQTLGCIGVPWWPVIGNHDVNLRARNDAHSDETWERVFGPPNYAFQVGRVHFVVLDSDVYAGWDDVRRAPGGYRKGFGADELAFLEHYLTVVPRDDLLVVAMHIPLALPEGARSAGADRLLTLLSSHPHTLSISAHTHRQFQLFLGREHGFRRREPHHHLNAGATSGSWWLGAADEDGIPHATMRDGAPNGTWLVHFDGPQYRFEFRPARRPADHQINVIAPFRVEAARAGETEVLANVFAGSERTRVSLQVDSGAWRPMRPTRIRDPLYEAVRRREQVVFPVDRGALRAPGPSTHIWRATLSADLAPGSHVLTVRADDPYAGTLWGRHIVHAW